MVEGFWQTDAAGGVLTGRVLKQERIQRRPVWSLSKLLGGDQPLLEPQHAVKMRGGSPLRKPTTAHPQAEPAGGSQRKRCGDTDGPPWRQSQRAEAPGEKTGGPKTEQPDHRRFGQKSCPVPDGKPLKQDNRVCHGMLRVSKWPAMSRPS